MNAIQEVIAKFKDLFKPTESGSKHPEAARPDEEIHVASDDEKLDQMLEDSFPASDPPGHISKSAEDLRQY